MFIIPTGMMMGAKVRSRTGGCGTRSRSRSAISSAASVHRPRALRHLPAEAGTARSCRSSLRRSGRVICATLDGFEDAMTGDFEPEQKRYLEGFMAGLQSPSRRAGFPACLRPPRRRRRSSPVPTRRISPPRTASSKAAASSPTRRSSSASSIRSTATRQLKAQAAGNEPPKPDDNFRWRFFGLFYCAPTQNDLHVPAAHPQRHPEALAVRGVADLAERLCRRLCPRHHPRQPADARDRAEERGRHRRGHPRPRPVLARLRRRQHPQRHRHARPRASIRRS